MISECTLYFLCIHVAYMYIKVIAALVIQPARDQTGLLLVR